MAWVPARAERLAVVGAPGPASAGGKDLAPGMVVVHGPAWARWRDLAPEMVAVPRPAAEPVKALTKAPVGAVG